MTTESQNELNARHAELTELAKWNVCGKCGHELYVKWNLIDWFLWCPHCLIPIDSTQIKPKLTPDEIIRERTRKAEEAVKQPRYNVDEILKEM